MDEKYERINITLPKGIIEKFRDFCERNGINISSRISVLIKRDLEDKTPLK